MPSHYADTFKQRLYVRHYQSVNARGEEQHGAATPYACRSESFNRLVRDTGGNQVVAGTRIFTEAAITVNDLVFPPGADPADIGQSQKALKVDEAVDLETGLVDHCEVYL